MSEGEVSARILRTIAFCALSAAGLSLIFGLRSRVMLLVLVIALCMLFSMMVRLAAAASFGVFVIGILLWSGLVPKSIESPDVSWLTGRSKSDQGGNAVARPPDLAGRLEQLGVACHKGLLSESECKATKESLLSKFMAGSQ